MRINKKKFIEQMAKNGHTTQVSCRKYLDLAFQTFYELLEDGHEIKFSKVLTAKVVTTPQRPAIVPKSGIRCIIPERKRIKVKISKVLKDKLNEQN